METYKRPRIAAPLVIIIFGALVSLAVKSATAAESVRLIIAPRATLLTAEGNIVFDAYLYNEGENKRRVPAPDAISDVVWTLRDILGNRPERRGSGGIIGTDAVETYVLNSQMAVHCVLTTHFDSEPGDLLEFHIRVNTKLNKSKTDLKPDETIASNSVILYRPKIEK